MGLITVKHVNVGNVQTKSNDCRIVSVKIDETQHTFRIDTDADATVISKSVFHDKFQHKILRFAQILRGPDIKQLRTLGSFKTCMVEMH